MSYLIIDVETSGLFNFKLPADHESQPHLASIAMLKVTDDFQCVDGRYHLIKPDGWEMTEGATKVNGLTTEMLQEYGQRISPVLEVYANQIRQGLTVVSFNAQFDLKQMRAELRRAGKDDLFEQTKNICMMRAYTDVCKLDYARPRPSKFKFPKLTEACEFAGIPFCETHNALADALPVLELMKRYPDLAGQPLPEPAVYHHPNYDEIKDAK